MSEMSLDWAEVGRSTLMCMVLSHGLGSVTE